MFINYRSIDFQKTTIFGYIFPCKLLHAKKLTIFNSFLRYSSLAFVCLFVCLFFFLHGNTSVFSNVSSIIRFFRLFILSLWLSDLSSLLGFLPGLPWALCNHACCFSEVLHLTIQKRLWKLYISNLFCWNQSQVYSLSNLLSLNKQWCVYNLNTATHITWNAEGFIS